MKRLVSSPGPAEFNGTSSGRVLYIRNVFTDNEEYGRETALDHGTAPVVYSLGDEWNVLKGGSAKTERLIQAAMSECEALLPLYLVERRLALQLEKRAMTLLKRLRKTTDEGNWFQRQERLRRRRLLRLFVSLRRMKPGPRWHVKFRPNHKSRLRKDRTTTPRLAIRVDSGILVEEQLVEDIWTDYARASRWLLAQE